MAKTLIVTGHRPDKLGGYSEALQDELRGFALNCIAEQEPDRLVTGMALGWDQACAWAASELEIPWMAAIPFEGQEKPWKLKDRNQYRKLLGKANKVVNCYDLTLNADSGDKAFSHPEDYSRLMLFRNIWMVDWGRAIGDKSKLLALYNGQPGGGTAHCVNYAKVESFWIENKWNEWVNWSGVGKEIKEWWT